MPHELSVALLDEITAKHQQGIALDQQLREILLRKLEVTRECGILLDESQHEFKGERWKEFADKLPFDSNALRMYIKFARKHPEPVNDISQAMRCAAQAALTTGLLQFPNGQRPEKIHEPNFFSRVTIAIQSLAVEWKKYSNRHPLKTWPDETKTQFLETLKPIALIYHEVASSLKNVR